MGTQFNWAINMEFQEHKIVLYFVFRTRFQQLFKFLHVLINYSQYKFRKIIVGANSGCTGSKSSFFGANYVIDDMAETHEEY